MSEQASPTPYPTVNEALHDLQAQVQTTLAPQFLGMYLTGSLALGDFDLHSSDIDYIVVTDGPLAPDYVAALQEIHERFDAGGSPWAGKIEAVYVAQGALNVFPTGGAAYPQVEKDRGFFVEPLEIGWIFQCYILREHGVALAGPTPRLLIAPIDPDALRRAAYPVAAMWFADARDRPDWWEWLRERSAQAFVVLTLCRLLYTLEYGAVASKPGAAHWAQTALGEQWAGLIARALTGQHDREAAAEADVNSTVELVRQTITRFRAWDPTLPPPPD